MNFRDLFYFDKFLFPKVITFIYWLILLGSVIAFISGVMQGQIFGGLVALIAGVVIGRIYCELMVVMFKINDHLTILSRKALQESNVSATNSVGSTTEFNINQDSF